MKPKPVVAGMQPVSCVLGIVNNEEMFEQTSGDPTAESDFKMPKPEGGAEEWDALSKVTLIHCYRDEPHIWSASVVYRSDGERRHYMTEAWRRIQQRMSTMGYNFDLPQLKKKMKQLRDQFSRENKMFEDRNSKWQFYEELSFLNQNENPSHSTSYQVPSVNVSRMPVHQPGVNQILADALAQVELLSSGVISLQRDVVDVLQFKLADGFRNRMNSGHDFENEDEASQYMTQPPTTSQVSTTNVAGGTEAGDTPYDANATVNEDSAIHMGTEMKSEGFGDISEFSMQGYERRGVMVSSSGIVLSETVMDELIRLVLSRKSAILNDACDEDSKNRAWQQVHEFLKGVAQVMPSVDELKEVFRRKQLHISEIVGRHAKADVSSAQGFARYIHSIVNKCLPEDKYTTRERELGTLILRKSFCPQQCTVAPAKRPRLSDGVSNEHDEQIFPRTSRDRQSSPVDVVKRCNCSCFIEDECLRESLTEMVKAQKEYFTVAAEVQKEQLRLFASFGEVLSRLAAKHFTPILENE